MNHRKLVVASTGVLLLAPSVAMANGMGRMIQSFEFTLAGGLIGCVAGVIIALIRQAKFGKLLALTIGGGWLRGWSRLRCSSEETARSSFPITWESCCLSS